MCSFLLSFLVKLRIQFDDFTWAKLLKDICLYVYQEKKSHKTYLSNTRNLHILWERYFIQPSYKKTFCILSLFDSLCWVFYGKTIWVFKKKKKLWTTICVYGDWCVCDEWVWRQQCGWDVIPLRKEKSGGGNQNN